MNKTEYVSKNIDGNNHYFETNTLQLLKRLLY